MSRNGIEIRIGLSSCGIASGGEAVREALLDAVRQAGLDEDVVKTVGCNGMCHREPLIEIGGGAEDGLLYGNVTPQMARRIVRRHMHADRLLTRARWAAGRLIDTFGKNGTSTQDSALDRSDDAVTAYLDKQKRIVLENCGLIDPLRIEDYLANNGYQALARILGKHQEWTELAGGNGHAESQAMTPQDVVDAITASGLRGRGGAGFPTGRKWSFALGQSATTKYVICNGDEGDPGAFMDRLVLEADPHRVLEGLAIAAYAIGAREGFLYIRAEYPLAVRHINDAIRQAEQRGLLGKNVLGSDFDIRLGLFLNSFNISSARSNHSADHIDRYLHRHQLRCVCGKRRSRLVNNTQKYLKYFDPSIMCLR